MPVRIESAILIEAIERIAARGVRADSGCLEWSGYREDGYGRIMVRPYGSLRVHRLVYEFHYGPPVQMVLHRCNNRACHEPTHLYDGSAVDNSRDAIAAGTAYVPTSPNKDKTHCVHGHALSGQNVRLNSRGHRTCLQCERDRAQRRHCIRRNRHAAIVAAARDGLTLAELAAANNVHISTVRRVLKKAPA